MKYPQFSSVFVFAMLGYVATGEFVPKLQSAKLVERLNPRSGCGTGQTPPSIDSCCGQPWNYGQPCDCGVGGTSSFSTHLTSFRRSLPKSSLREVDKLLEFQGLNVQFVAPVKWAVGGTIL